MRNLEDSLKGLDHHYIEMLKYLSRNFDANLAMLENAKFDSTLYGESKIMEDSINAFEVKIKEDCIITIARFQPAAKNLRKLVMIINSVRVIERMGDLLKANLKIIRDIEKKSPTLAIELTNMVYPVAKKIKDIYDLYVKSFIENDTSTLYDILYLDEEIDTIMKNNDIKFLELMKLTPDNIDGGSLLILLDKKFERLSDHIVHLVTDLIYILKGENMRKMELISRTED
ncbi:MAG: PhoU domain-containing protein [Cetobacterium sp.]|uniref:phosphate signaling complex PhoU family protein n=1 Tax=unclassified Cetobacterium TaxID=2630983 RepID=UPI00163B6712|nr:PhoU domain-containing protein [Cetobacterium sp. 2A]MBC2855938.1 hypothetical protein [Cetobacterium sp. 2A]